MSKLVLAFVQEADVEPIIDALRAGGHRFTRIPSFGGFLGEPNQTIALAVEDEALPSVLSVFERTAQPRDVDVPLVLLERLSDWRDRKVHLGGATILVSDLEGIFRF
jgi:uncharacterized protein YaaQ